MATGDEAAIPLPHESRQPGDSCPECGQGQLSEQARPAVMMSFIHTSELCGVTPRDYLTELLRHERELAANPACWMPRNYRQTLAAVPAATGPPATATSDTLATVP